MFGILYSFEVKAGEEKRFRDAWRGLTLFYKQHANSWGSRLHRSSEGSFIAYAQWPDERTFEAAGLLQNEEAAFFGREMRATCLKIQKLHHLQLEEDFLGTIHQ